MALPPGITPISTSFSNRIAAPFDGKTKFPTIAERNSCEYLYVGIIVFVTETAKHYKLDTLPSSSSANWSEFTASSPGGGGLEVFATNALMLAAEGLTVGDLVQSNEAGIGGLFRVATSGSLTADSINIFTGTNFDFERDYAKRGITPQNSAYGDVILESNTLAGFDPDAGSIPNNKLVSIKDSGLFRIQPLGTDTEDGGIVIDKTNYQLKRAAELPNHGFHLEFFGFDVGELETKYPGNTYAQNKVIRQANMTAFVNCCNIAKTLGIPVIIPPNICEIHTDQSASYVTIGDGETLRIKGDKTFSKILVYPKVDVSETIFLFDLENGGNIYFKDFECSSFPQKWYRETYLATLKVGGNARLIEIDAGETIRASGFWDNAVGKEIFYQKNDSVIAYSATISSVNSGSRQITVSTDLDASIANNDTSATSYISVSFEEDDSDADIALFGKLWKNKDSIFRFIDSSIGHAVYDKDVILSLDGIKSEHFNYAIGVSGGRVFMYEKDCEFSGKQVGLGFFKGDNVNPSMVTSRYCRYYECGSKVVGTYEGYISTGNVWGSGVYAHPNARFDVIGTIYDDGPANNFRQYSSSGPKTVNEGDQSYFENVTFGKSEDHSAIFSNSMPTTTRNCKFRANSVLIGFNHKDYNSEFFLDATITFNSNSEPELQDIVIFFSNTIFYYGSTLGEVGWTEAQAARTSLHLQDIKIYVGEKTVDVPQTILVLRGTENRKLGNIIVDGLATYNEGLEETELDDTRPTEIGQDILNAPNQEITLKRVTPFHKQINCVFISNSIEPNVANWTIEDSKFHYTSFIGSTVLGHASQFKIRNCEKFIAYNNVLNGLVSFKESKDSKITQLGGVRHRGLYKGDYTPANGIRVFADNNYYVVKGDTLNHISPVLEQGNYSKADGRRFTTFLALNGKISILFLDACTIKGYDYTDNQDGNIIGNHNFKAGEVGVFELVNYYPLGQSEQTETIVLGVGDGSTTVFSSTSDALKTKPIVKGSASLTADTITGTETELGIIEGTGITKCFFNHIGERFYIEFDVAPANAVDIELDYTYIQNPVWASRWVRVGAENKFVGTYERDASQTFTENTAEVLDEFALLADSSTGSGITYSAGEFTCTIAGVYNVNFNDYFLRTDTSTDSDDYEIRFKLQIDRGSGWNDHNVRLYNMMGSTDVQYVAIDLNLPINLEVDDKIRFQATVDNKTANGNTLYADFNVGVVVISRN